MRHSILAVLLLAVSAAAAVQDDTAGLRLITVGSRAESDDLRARIQGGEPFETLAREHSTDASAPSGGYLGRVSFASLRPEFRAALAGLDRGDVSAVIQVGSEFILLQLLTEVEEAWTAANSAGLEALAAGRYDEAERFFEAALGEAEGFGPGDSRLALSLNRLGALHHLRRDYSRAASLYGRSLANWEQAVGPDHPEVADALNNLAEVYRLLGDYREAEPLYRRSLAIRGRLLGDDHSDVAQSLSNLAELLELKGLYAEAEALYQRSLAIREQALGPDEPEVAKSLDNLARLYRLQENYREAETLYRRSISILERTLGPQHANLSESLTQLAAVLQHQGNYTEAESFYGRALGLRWGRASDREQSAVLPLLDTFTTLLSLAPFGDDRAEQARNRLHEILSHAMLDEDVYLAMCDIFVEAGLEMEAETILRGAVQTFPASRLLRYELAERLAASEHPAAALDVFEIAARIAAPAAQDSIADMRERSSIYRRIGDMHMALTQFDEAASAFRAALEIDPSNVAARLGLGRLYSQEIMFDEAASAFRTALEIDSSNVAARLGLGRLYSQENMFDEALTEYAAVILEHPENVDAYMGRAEVHERVGRFLEAAEEAGRALAIEPDHQTAHYLLGRALIRVGRTAEGQDHLKEYQRLEAEANARLSMRREVVSARGEAAEHLIDGRYEEAIAVLNKAIDENPDAVPFYVTIGLAESARGRHGEAVATFQRIVALGAGDFLVHYNLAEIYQLMGRIEASRRHRTIYLQQINDELQMRSGRIESSWTIATSAR